LLRRLLPGWLRATLLRTVRRDLLPEEVTAGRHKQAGEGMMFLRRP